MAAASRHRPCHPDAGLRGLGPRRGRRRSSVHRRPGTRAIDAVADGRAASRRADPTEWGTSRVSGEELRYRFDGASDDVENLFTIRTRPLRANAHPSGCFGSRRAFSSGGVASISIDTLRPVGRGRFSNDRTIATSNPTRSSVRAG